MAKISFDLADKHYTLEYTRATVKQMEQNGFSLAKIEHQPVTMLTMLFAGAFLAHHKRVATDSVKVEWILSKLKNKDEMYDTLIDMYQDAMLSMMDEEDDDTEDDAGAEGNVTWGKSE